MDEELRKQLIAFLKGNESHMGFEEAVKDFPQERMNDFPPNVEYTPWHLLEHMRITQWDILDFIRNKDYEYIEWPKDYWPARDAKASKKDWDKTVKDFMFDLEELIKMVEGEEIDLGQKVPWGEGQTLIREMIMIIDHNSYHLGEFAILRQVMGTWGKDKE